MFRGRIKCNLRSISELPRHSAAQFHAAEATNCKITRPSGEKSPDRNYQFPHLAASCAGRQHPPSTPPHDRCGGGDVPVLVSYGSRGPYGKGSDIAEPKTFTLKRKEAMPPPVRSAEREGRPNHCGRRRRARMPIPSAEDSADAVRIFYCIRVETAHNVRDNDVCVRCENKHGEPPNCCGRKCYERVCCGQRRCRQRRRGRKHHARTPIPPADGSAGAVRIF